MDTALITGCSSGIGRATALAFAQADWRVYATARDTDDIADLAEAGCETAALDVSDEGAITAVIERIAEEVAGVDALINNAGYGQFGPLEDLPTAELRRQFDVNVYGPHRLAQAVLPGMRERGEGRIINVSSNLGRVAVATGGAYCGSKFALEAMSDALRTEVAPHGIDVVLIEPGPVSTRFGERVLDEVADLDKSGAYGPFYRVLEDSRSVTRDGPFTVSAETVADAILNAASCTSPAPRYRVGSVAKLTEVVRLVPDRWRDAVTRLVIRLAK